MLENVRQNHDSFTGNQCLVTSIFEHNSTGYVAISRKRFLLKFERKYGEILVR